MEYYKNHEVEEDDINEEVDAAMEIEQKRKLGMKKEIKINKEREKELEEQALKFKEYQKKREEIMHLTRIGIAQYDLSQTKEGYKSFEEACRDNDLMSDQEEDDEMERVLREKLGVYNEKEEVEEVRQKRLKRRNAIDAKLELERTRHQENALAIEKKMEQYHEQNKSRVDYKKFNEE